MNQTELLLKKMLREFGKSLELLDCTQKLQPSILSVNSYCRFNIGTRSFSGTQKSSYSSATRCNCSIYFSNISVAAPFLFNVLFKLHT